MVIIVIISLYAIGTKMRTEAPTYDSVARQKTPQEYIVEYSKQFNTDPNLLLKIARCESQFDPLTKGDYKDGQYLAIGLYQYHAGMWDDSEKLYRKDVYDEDLDRNSYQDQAKLTAFIFAEHPNLRTKWTSYVAYANGGTYKFYSKLLGKNYTVVCK